MKTLYNFLPHIHSVPRLTNIISVLKIIKVFIMKFSPVSFNCLQLRPVYGIFLRILLSDTPLPMFLS